MTMPRSTGPAPARFSVTYVGWVIAFLVIVLCILGIAGVFPADPKWAYGMILLLAIAVFF